MFIELSCSRRRWFFLCRFNFWRKTFKIFTPTVSMVENILLFIEFVDQVSFLFGVYVSNLYDIVNKNCDKVLWHVKYLRQKKIIFMWGMWCIWYICIVLIPAFCQLPTTKNRCFTRKSCSYHWCVIHKGWKAVPTKKNEP